MSTAQAIANEFLKLSFSENKQGLTNLQIQKLVYIAYGYFSFFEKERLFDEKIEAWQHGPVIPALYYEAKRFGSDKIKKNFRFTNSKYTQDKDDLGDPIMEVEDAELKDSSKEKRIISFVFRQYGKQNGWSLRGLTHRDGSPWDKIYQGGMGCFEVIPYNTIKEYYKSFVPALYESLSNG